LNGCDKAQGEGVWLFALPSRQMTTGSLFLSWSATKGEDRENDLDIWVPNEKTSSHGATLHSNSPLLLHSAHGLLHREPLFNVRFASPRKSAYPIRISASLQDPFNGAASPRLFEADLPVANIGGGDMPVGCVDNDYELYECLKSTQRLTLSEYSVIGSYSRFSARVRASIQTFVDTLRNSLQKKSYGNENFVISGPSGCGKSHLIEEFKASLGDGCEYFTANVSIDTEEYVRKIVSDVDIERVKPVLCFFDEMDSDKVSDWSCEAVFNALRTNGKVNNSVVCVIAGSRAGGSDAMLAHIRGFRNKGEDLCSRLGTGDCYRLEIPRADFGDKIIIFVSTLVSYSKRQGRTIKLIDKLALHYLLTNRSIDTASKVANVAKGVVDRLGSESRVTVLHMASNSDGAIQRYLMGGALRVQELLDASIEIGP
jgi:hypothetical protein